MYFRKSGFHGKVREGLKIRAKELKY